MKNRVFITVLTTLLFSGCSGQTNDELLSQASNSFDQQNYNEAVVLLKNLLVVNPQDSEARLLLAKSQFRLGAYDAAVKNYESLSEVNTVDYEFSAEYIEALYRTESYVTLLDITDNTENTAPQVLYFRSMALVKLGRNKDASDLLNTLLSAEQQGIANVAGIAKTIAEGKLEKALAMINENEFPLELESEVKRLKSQILSAMGQFDKSIEELQALVKMHPLDNTLKLFLALEYAKSGDFEKGNEIADYLMERAPDQPLLNRIKGYYLAKKQNLEGALNYLEKAHQNGPKSDALLLDIAQIAYELGQTEKAHRYLNLIENVSNKKAYDNLTLAVSLRLGYELENIPSFIADNNESFSNEAISRAALDLMKLNQGHLSSKIYEMQRARNAEGSGSLSVVGIQLNDDSALEFIEQDYLENKSRETRALLAASLIRLEKFEEAELLANSWVESGEDLEMGYQTLATVAIEQGTSERIDFYMQKLLDTAPSNRFANVFLAKKQAAQGHSEKAQQLFKKLIADYPGEPRIIKNAYDSLKPSNNEQPILRIIKEKQSEVDIANVGIFTGIYLAERMYEEIVDLVRVHGINAELSEKAWSDYIFALRALGKVKTSVDENKKWLNLKPESLVASMSMVVSYELIGDPQAALETLTKLEKRFGITTNTTLTRIYFQILTRNLKKAETEMAVLINDEPSVVEMPFFKGLEGRIFYFKQSYNEAIIGLEEEYKSTRNEKTLKFLASALHANGQTKKAINLLEEYTKANPSDILSLLQLAELANGVNSAVEEGAYLSVLKIEPKNIFAVNNYSVLLLNQGRLKDAQNLIETVISPTQLHPDVIDTAARIYAASENRNLGNNLFEHLISKTKNKYSSFLYLQYLQDTKQFDSAKIFYDDNKALMSSHKKEIDEFSKSW